MSSGRSTPRRLGADPRKSNVKPPDRAAASSLSSPAPSGSSLVYAAEARGRQIHETDKLEGAFVPPLDVLRIYDRLETWSALLYDYRTERSAGVRLDAPGTPTRRGR